MSDPARVDPVPASRVARGRSASAALAAAGARPLSRAGPIGTTRATGVAVNLIELGRVTRDSFQQALAAAFIAIVSLIFALWRRVAETLLVMAPLLLSAALTGAAVVLLDSAFNFANVIVIPLMFGVGVDSAIHLVHQAREQASAGDASNGEDLLGSTTARAVFYSALTTTVSFGSLAFSSHTGMASLGILLTIGMVLSVICNLIVLPALISMRHAKAREAR